MRLPLLLICASLLATGIVSAGAAEGSIWIEGRWENCDGQYQWRQGYWQTTTTTTVQTSAPAQRWVEGHWAQGANNNWGWVEGHYEQFPAVVSAPAYPPPQPQVVVVQQPRPTTTVVVGGGYGYGYGYHHRPVVHCPPPVVHCPPPVVHCPPRRPVYCPPPVTHCPPVRSGGSVHVSLPRPSLVFPTVKVGGHRLPLPPIPVFKHR